MAKVTSSARTPGCSIRPHRVKLAYERIFNRPPAEAEIEAALTFVKSKTDASQAWTALCQGLWASHEFLGGGYENNLDSPRGVTLFVRSCATRNVPADHWGPESSFA